VRGSAPSSAAGDRRCILIGLSFCIWLDQVDVACFPVCKCINVPNDVCIDFPGCLDGMIGWNVGDRTCDQGRSGTCDQAVAAVSICSRSRRIWKSIRPDSVSSIAAASDGMCCNRFQIDHFPTSGLRGLGGDLHARRPRSDSSADRPFLACGCFTRFPRLYCPCTSHHPSLPLLNHPLPPAVPVHPSPLRCHEGRGGRMPGADRGRGQGGCLEWSELALYVIV